ncbi:AAA family ATPase [Alsobacter sp. SYSU M60028]|uniref:AAA family ATPase n=1 Tax=Alsobacter ponti TaxID=2962936 RepID=A0ABT1L8Y9_9HYPH|nr:YhaN family protein [Alsobacter ponti]MCP8937884.1 AAA family ATPase [Alsobacter ponti]
MRLLRLDLDRYGPFTGKVLEFRPDARLHVVYGPNEAGKTCSLAAITDLLFGIPARTRHDFVHPMRELRLGASVVDRAGRGLDFRRRKNRPVLTDAEGAELPDDALVPFLGGLSREVFCRAFGLDAEALRKSGDDLRKTDGELGAALFAAASGLRGLTELRAELDAEADAIFAPRAAKDRRFYQALARYEEARKALRDSEFRSGPLKALRDGIAEHEARLEAIAGRRAAIARDLARLERLRRAAPVIRAIDAIEADMAALGELPAVHEGFGAELAEALAALEAARERLRGAEAAEARHAANASSIAADPGVLPHGDEIDRLTGQSGAWEKARADLPKVRSEADAFDAELTALAVRLGLPDADAVIAGQPSDAVRAGVEALVAEGERLAAALAAARAAEEQEAGTLATLRREREARGGLREPGPARAAFAAFAEPLKRVDQMSGLREEVYAEAAELASEAARLSPRVADLAALADVALPSLDVIEAARRRLAERDGDIKRAAEALAETRREAAQAEAGLAALEAGRPVPSAERIAAARAARESEWSTLRASLFGEADALAPATLAGVVARFEREVAEADSLADAAVADAQRVVEHALTRQRLDRALGLARDQEAALAALRAERDADLAAWAQLWTLSGVAPAAPAEMLAWRVELGVLLERHARLSGRRARLAAMEDDARRLDAPLAALARDLGLPPVPDLPATLQASRIEAEIARIADLWTEAREAEARLADTEARMKDATERAAAAAQRLAEWGERCRAALPALGLPPDAGVAEARAALDAWKEAPRVIENRADRMRRVAGIRRDIAAFENAVATLASALGAEAAGLPPDATLRGLGQRLARAREATARRDEIDKQLAQARGERDAAAGLLAEAERALAERAGRVHAAPGDDLPGLARRLADRDRLSAKLRERRDQLALEADGVDEAALREALAGHDPDATDAARRALADEDERLDGEGKEAFAALDREKRRMRELEEGGGAELAAQQRRGAEVELVTAAREWAVLSLGALMLGTAVERQRAGRQAPLLARAGALFSTVTGGAFVGLGQSFGDDDAPHLVGRRAGGDEVALADMSEGTRDQLYLSLRLSFLEDYAQRAEPAPFVGDDLFASFDDERTENGLAALAAIGETVQPILITHHRAVVDAAQRRLGGAVDILAL